MKISRGNNSLIDRQKTMINADWVQLNCRVKPLRVESCRLEYEKTAAGSWQVQKTFKSGIPYDRIYTEIVETNQVPFNQIYDVKRQAFRTSLADSVYYVHYQNAKIAEVLADVTPGMNIDVNTIFVRFDNRFLYGANLYDRVKAFLDDNGLEFHNWTRFDVCCDFHNFKFNDTRPEVFIRRYTQGEYRLLNKRRGAKRKGCVWFEDGEKGIDFQTLRLGSKYSAVNTKLYNKSKELSDEHDKPYIRESWALNGLLTQDDIDQERKQKDGKQDVWRLEFSINDFKTIAVEHDEIKFAMNTLEILKDENVAQLWNLLREHYFVFYRANDRDKNVSRKAKLELFDYVDTGMKLREVLQKEDTTRAHKIFIKKLLDTQAKIRANNDLKAVTWASDYIASWLVYQHDLKEWSKLKFPGWRPEDYKNAPAIAEGHVFQYTLNLDGTHKAERHKFTY